MQLIKWLSISQHAPRSNMTFQFSFGPNHSFFCSAGSVYAWSDNPLPKGLASLLEDKYHPQAMGTPHDVAFPMEPEFYALCYQTATGEELYKDTCLGPNYTRLARFIKSAAASGHKTHTVFGPGHSYFSTSPAGYSWQNLTPALEEEIQHNIRTRRPTTVALGVDGTHVVLYEDGSVTANLRGQYPLVEALIINAQEITRRRGLMYIALNPFAAGEYLAVYNDRATTWQLPTAWSADVTTVCGQIRPAAYTAGTSTGGTAPPQAHAPPAYVATVAPQTNVVPFVTLEASLVEKYELAPAAQALAPTVATSEDPPAEKSGHKHKHKHKINWTEVEKGFKVGVQVVGDIAQIAQVVNNANQPQQS
ncbi:hypothetical protein C8R44DRAFT_858611 [Mycena epipterygia]|nr:hypothetical protein C8R44DRAFT_858611 [Mycena epipterygia]